MCVRVRVCAQTVSIRTGKNLEAFVGSLRGKKQAPKQPTAEEMEREMKRRTRMLKR